MPSFSKSLEAALHRALEYANERNHEYATLEHLLLSLLDDRDAAAVMRACNVDVDTLRRRCPSVQFVHAVTPEERAAGLIDCDVAYTWMLNADELATARNLKWVHTSAVAVETLCLDQLFARGIVVSNTRGVQAVPIAEHVMTMVLAFAKQLPFALDHQRRSRWAQNEFMGERLPWLLRGKTLGIIGVGTIGTEIAARLVLSNADPKRTLLSVYRALRLHEHRSA